MRARAPSETSPAPQRVVPILSESEYEYGNVRRCFVSGRAASLDPEIARTLPLGRRRQRKGVLYDESFPGFTPSMWPHVVCLPEDGVGSHRIALEGAGDLFVWHEREVDPVLPEIAERWLGAHVPCREGEGSHGEMMGVGQHLRRDGQIGDFVLHAGEEGRHSITADEERAARHFQRVFGGRGVGYEDLLRTMYSLLMGSPKGVILYWAHM